MRVFFTLGCIFWIAGAALYGQTRVNEKAIASLHNMFGNSASITSTVQRLRSSASDSIALASRSRWLTDTLRVYVCRAHDNIIGYGFVDEVKGKTQQITYLAGIRPDGEVQDIDVLVYRESYGGEIAHESFRNQFRGKTVTDKLQPGRDIKNISGASISVRAITAGIKKILLTFELLKPGLR